MNVEAYILTGGKSSRFGSDKSLAQIGGITLAKRAHDLVRRALPKSRCHYVAGGTDEELIGVATIKDSVADRGPIGGLHASLENAKAEWIFLFACDLPLMTSEFISRLCEECRDEFDAVVPEQPDGRLQPICAFYRVAAALPVVREVIEQDPNAAMMVVFEKLNTRIVRANELVQSDPEIWTNVNRRHDLDEIARKLSYSETI